MALFFSFLPSIFIPLATESPAVVCRLRSTSTANLSTSVPSHLLLPDRAPAGMKDKEPCTRAVAASKRGKRRRGGTAGQTSFQPRPRGANGGPLRTPQHIGDANETAESLIAVDTLHVVNRMSWDECYMGIGIQNHLTVSNRIHIHVQAMLSRLATCTTLSCTLPLHFTYIASQ